MEHYHGFLVEYLGDYDTENLFIFLNHLGVVFVKKCWFDSFACWRNWFLQKLICLTSLFSRREIWMWYRYGNVLSWIWLFSLLAWEVMRRNSNFSETKCINIFTWFLCPVLKKSLFKTMKTFIYFTFRTFFKMYLLLEPLPFHFLSL